MRTTFWVITLLLLNSFETSANYDSLKVQDQTGNVIKEVLVIPLYLKQSGTSVGLDVKNGTRSKRQLIVKEPFIFVSGNNIRKQCDHSVVTPGKDFSFQYSNDSGWRFIFIAKGYTPKYVSNLDVGIIADQPVILNKGQSTNEAIEVFVESAKAWNNPIQQGRLKELFQTKNSCVPKNAGVMGAGNCEEEPIRVELNNKDLELLNSYKK